MNDSFKCFLLSAMLVSPCFAGDRTYTVIDLGTLGGESSAAYDLNDAAQVVGYAEDTNGHRRAYLWQNGTMTDLGTFPNGTNSEANGINAAGYVTGVSDVEGMAEGNPVFHAFLFDGSILNDLGTLGGTNSVGYAINDSGAIAGWAMEPGSYDPQACLYKTNMVDLGTYDGWYSSEAFDVNNSTQIVGMSFLWTPDPEWHPFLWIDANGDGVYSRGEMTDLGLFSAEARFGTASGINRFGQIVGGADVSTYNPGKVRHAFLVTPKNGDWYQDTDTNGVNDLMTDLGSLGGDSADAADINDSGVIVGSSLLADNTTTNAFIVENGVMTNLNTMISTNSGWVLTAANAINGAGEIVGVGVVSGKVHGFLLSLSMKIFRMPPYGTDYELVWTNELSEVVTQKLQTVDGFVLHWSSGWTGKDTASVYTVEAREPRGTNDWAVITPTSQWPILGMSWTNSLDGGPRDRLFRVRATSWPGP